MTFLRAFLALVTVFTFTACYEIVPADGVFDPTGEVGPDYALSGPDTGGRSDAVDNTHDASVDLSLRPESLFLDADSGGIAEDATDDEEPVVSDAGAPEATPDPPHFVLPILYPADRIQSPVTGYVATTLREIAASNPDLADNVFMKVGASGTVSTNLLYCFAGWPIDLDGRDHLQETIDFFLAGNGNDHDQEGDQTPFNRPTYAAKVGRTAKWAITGSPSPIDLEIEAISPRFALINYGTNDMHMGTTYASAMWGFYESYMTLLDQVEDEGSIPILVGANPRTDSTSADRWIPTYNAVVRGMAQSRQVPFLDLHLAVEPLPGGGLAGDGLHSNVYYDGGARPCIFDEHGLQYGYNMRNLITLETLDRMKAILFDEVEFLDEEDDLFLAGDGSREAPFEIPGLPFAHSADTNQSMSRDLDLYTGCDSEANESGPELLYQLVLPSETAIRAIVLDREGVDIDIHLLGGSGFEDDCIRRDHHYFQGTLPAGRYFLSLDTWVNSSREELGGDYLVVILECDSDDSDCGQILL